MTFSYQKNIATMFRKFKLKLILELISKFNLIWNTNLALVLITVCCLLASIKKYISLG